MVFKGFKSLNRIQSIVYDMAYNTNENLLVAAPTGAGKTNIALLTITHEIRNNIKEGVLKKDSFKVLCLLFLYDIQFQISFLLIICLACFGGKFKFSLLKVATKIKLACSCSI